MDNDSEFSDLEEELRRLRPATLSTTWLARVESAMSEPVPQRFARESVSLSSWLAWPMAACFVGVVAWLSGAGHLEDRLHANQKTVSANAAYKPVGAEKILYDVRDEGLTTLNDGTIARQVRDCYLDVITWKNATASSSVRWSVPRDEVRLIPVEAY